jgi:hypothetical protein
MDPLVKACYKAEESEGRWREALEAALSSQAPANEHQAKSVLYATMALLKALRAVATQEELVRARTC